ncbi:MAG: UDP binding domain-containing protein, partial [Candidatus Lokiarchaeota archaeon]|nr:UDP binding domain-containing protein [Candidatus Lokiarchaeota archaeon]
TDNLEEAFTGADVLIFATNHKQYYELDIKKMKSLMNTPIVIDGRNIFISENMKKEGFNYRKVGTGQYEFIKD